ncbi:MAG: acyloxyacyl hydrolase [Pseudomonadota bacterium]
MTLKLIVASTLAVGVASAAHAQDTYVSVSGGATFLNDSDNEGTFVGDFATGEGTTIPAGTVLPDGTGVGWTTEFDTGWMVNGAVGRDFGWFRGEIEVGYQSNGVDTHTGVTAAGTIPLDSEDAAVLITGQDTNLGVTVGDLVAAGQGEVETVFVMANAFLEYENTSPFTPYVGIGAGVGFVDVNYAPSATTIIDDNSTEFAYQAMAGIGYEVTPNTTLFAGYRYRATLDANVDASLFDANFDIENRASTVEAGLRVSF